MVIEQSQHYIGIRVQPDTNFSSLTDTSIGNYVSITTGTHAGTGNSEVLLYKFDKRFYDQQTALQWVISNTYSPLPQNYAPTGPEDTLIINKKGRLAGYGGLIEHTDDIRLKTPAEKTAIFDPAPYDDLPPVSLLTAQRGPSVPSLETLVGRIQQLTFGINDEVFATSEIIHTYKEGEDLDLHIHWVTNGLDTTERTVKYELDVSVANGNADETFTTSQVYPLELTIPANTPDRTYYVNEFGFIDGASLKIGAYICFSFRRVASSGTEPSDDPFALAIGFHAPNDTTGSRQRFVK